ncbi:hypothetical protein [Hoeflea alexandrii]
MEDRTLLTLAASTDLETLRAELNRVADEIADQNVTPEELGADLVKLGVSVSLPFSGPVAALMMLATLQRQIANSFPQEWETAKAKLTGNLDRDVVSGRQIQ